MSSFAPSDFLASQLADIRTFLEQRIVPLERTFLSKGFGTVEGPLEEIRREVRERGWWSPPAPRAVGGLELSLVDFVHLSTILGRSPLGHYCFLAQAPDAGNIEVLASAATPAQRKRFLEPLAAGRIRSCFAMTEPDRAGSNPVWMDCLAQRKGDGWVIDGRKWFATAAEGADFALVMAVTDPDGPRHQRASLLLVPTDTPGYRIVRNLPIMGPSDDGWASHSEVAFESCEVGNEALLGSVGEGFALAQRRLAAGRIHHCSRWLGVAERAFDLMAQRAVTRELAPGQVLADTQLVQAAVAVHRAQIDAARWLVLAAAEKVDREGGRAARAEISMIKFHVAGVLLGVLDQAIQIFGGAGLLDDGQPLAWFYRHERAARIYDGPDEVHQLAAGKRLLATYR